MNWNDFCQKYFIPGMCFDVVITFVFDCLLWLICLRHYENKIKVFQNERKFKITNIS
ncbi:hypothetical protein [Candidatus Phytoplasma phoenicium]|uniref:hypothetical protein n=1 Tax=Candidatus Phytoplasma phoenicium TaxID=198422 RepID=UPI000AD0D56A|nr:hypothetical protein [Candidatus Phytoplasma phoenicium]